jgi:hypothetical protein
VRGSGGRPPLPLLSAPELGFRVVHVWESQDALDAIAGKLMPILHDMGVQGQPEIYRLHTYVSA